ncbi:MAG: cytochrome c biogenesis protein CcdA [Candidatus Azambacteria bacterium]|nr:cytochrome c biogenesis protein CcdA [Candidatus Azambacteria bacterium]
MPSFLEFLPLVTTAAVIDSVNFCAFSVLLLTIAFLFSAGNTRSKILKVGGFYIAGIFLIYILIGLGLMKALYSFNTPHFMARVGASIMILFGVISIVNEFFPAFPIKLKISASAHSKMAPLIQKGSIPTAFFLGVLVGLYEFPCTGGPYLMILGFLRDNSTFIKGAAYLLFYNLVFVLPLVITLFIASNETLLGKLRAWRENKNIRIKFWSGIAMIILGIIIFML